MCKETHCARLEDVCPRKLAKVRSICKPVTYFGSLHIMFIRCYTASKLKSNANLLIGIFILITTNYCTLASINTTTCSFIPMNENASASSLDCVQSFTFLNQTFEGCITGGSHYTPYLFEENGGGADSLWCSAVEEYSNTSSRVWTQWGFCNCTDSPTHMPTSDATRAPSSLPTQNPSSQSPTDGLTSSSPTPSPVTSPPTATPSQISTQAPVSYIPSAAPTWNSPTSSQTSAPSTQAETEIPTRSPSHSPSTKKTAYPSAMPSMGPSTQPSSQPTITLTTLSPVESTNSDTETSSWKIWELILISGACGLLVAACSLLVCVKIVRRQQQDQRQVYTPKFAVHPNNSDFDSKGYSKEEWNDSDDESYHAENMLPKTGNLWENKRYSSSTIEHHEETVVAYEGYVRIPTLQRRVFLVLLKSGYLICYNSAVASNEGKNTYCGELWSLSIASIRTCKRRSSREHPIVHLQTSWHESLEFEAASEQEAKIWCGRIKYAYKSARLAEHEITSRNISSPPSRSHRRSHKGKLDARKKSKVKGKFEDDRWFGI